MLFAPPKKIVEIFLASNIRYDAGVTETIGTFIKTAGLKWKIEPTAEILGRRFQWLCRPTYKLGWYEETRTGICNKEERTILLRHTKQLSWSDLQQIVPASHSQWVKCNKKRRILGKFVCVPNFTTIFMVKI